MRGKKEKWKKRSAMPVAMSFFELLSFFYFAVLRLLALLRSVSP